MPMLRKPGFAWAMAIVLVLGLAVSGVVVGQPDGPKRISASKDAPAFHGVIPKDLPPVTRGGMNISPGPIEATSVLSFDDGSCESGLGAGVTASSLVDFDVPTQCVQSGLQIIQMTARMNTFNANAAALHQAGSTPNPATVGADTTRSISLAGLGPCPATTFDTVSFTPMTVTGTSNFFAGLVHTGWAGRDTNGGSTDRIWFNCAGCGDTQYSPTDLNNIGLGGAHFIRVTVEDSACIPVELMGFSVE